MTVDELKASLEEVPGHFVVLGLDAISKEYTYVFKLEKGEIEKRPTHTDFVDLSSKTPNAVLLFFR